MARAACSETRAYLCTQPHTEIIAKKSRARLVRLHAARRKHSLGNFSPNKSCSQRVALGLWCEKECAMLERARPPHQFVCVLYGFITIKWKSGFCEKTARRVINWLMYCLQNEEALKDSRKTWVATTAQLTAEMNVIRRVHLANWCTSRV